MKWEYTYDPAANNYARKMAGAPHVDRNNGAQIRVKNLVVQMMPTTYGKSRIGEQMTTMATVGRGTGWVIRDGGVVPITWVKDSHAARTKLLDAAGAEVPLNAGNTWYEIIPIGKNVSF